MRDGTHVLEIERRGIQARCVWTIAVQFIAVAVLAVLDVNITARLDQFTELGRIFLLEFAIGILQCCEVKALAIRLELGWWRGVDGTQFHRRLEAGRHA